MTVEPEFVAVPPPIIKEEEDVETKFVFIPPLIIKEEVEEVIE